MQPFCLHTPTILVLCPSVPFGRRCIEHFGQLIFALAYRCDLQLPHSSVVTIVARPTAHTSSLLYYFYSFCARVAMHMHRCITQFLSLLVLFWHVSSLKWRFHQQEGAPPPTLLYVHLGLVPSFGAFHMLAPGRCPGEALSLAVSVMPPVG